ncbi:MAG: Ig-like domain-containing protein, partial [Aeromicrobium sp.]
MIRAWMAAHKSAAATVISGTAIAALVATVAVVSTGYTSQRMDLDDGAVWVANGADNVIGRANTQIFELNTIVGGEGSDLSVVQDAESVLLVDRTNASLDAIDPATSEAGDTIALPPEQPQVFLAGDNVVIQEQGTGEVWIVSRADLAGFDPLATATRSFGEGAAIAVDDAGTLWAFRPDDSQLFQIDATRGDVVVAQFSVDLPEPSGDFEVTAASGRWAVLDTGTRRLATSGQTVDLSEWLPADSSPRLQAASSTGSRLLVAHAGGLLGVPFDGADPTVLLEGRSGRAAAPLAALGCSFSAWTDGTALRRCGGEATELSLAGMGTGADLVLSRRNGHVLLNDVQSGASWAVQGEGELIDNWADLIVDDTRQEEAEDNDEDTPPDVEEQQQPPIAVDDAFGARPGTATPLPVLLNDYDPNGDVLVVSAVTPIDEAVGRVDRINRNQQVQITLEPTATGVVTFEYTIDDGRGGEATAQVTVDIRSDAENAPPQQVRTSKTTVQSAGRVETQVLGDWVDPDGDPVYLVSASSSGDGDVTWKPDGTVIFRDNGDGGDLKSVTLVVSDGSAVGNGSLAVTVRPAGEVPIIADPFVVQTYAGESVTVRPLEHVRGGNGTIRLNAVPAKAGVSVEPSFQNGTFSFETDQVRTHYLEYVVTDDEQTATGLVRVDVAVPPEAGARPITVPKTVFITSSTQETVDVAATDIDPAGGVLLVTDVDDLPEDEGVRAEVLDQKSVRVTLTGPLDAPRTFGYTVSNGVADAPGTITVIEIPRPAQLQPPLAVDDTATARVGDVIDIPVLDNDEQPDGFDISLVPDLAEDLPEDGGLLFASGDRLRYLAPENAGN